MREVESFARYSRFGEDKNQLSILKMTGTRHHPNPDSNNFVYIARLEQLLLIADQGDIVEQPNDTIVDRPRYGGSKSDAFDTHDLRRC